MSAAPVLAQPPGPQPAPRQKSTPRPDGVDAIIVGAIAWYYLADKPADAISIIISARSGGVDGEVRIVREVVTTIPIDHVATMQIPLEFLCEGFGKLEAGNPASNCPIMGCPCLSFVAMNCSNVPTRAASSPSFSIIPSIAVFGIASADGCKEK